MAQRPSIEALKSDAAAGALLVAAALLALGLANSPARGPYFALLGRALPVQIGPWRETFSLRQWSLQALMPLFFYTVALEFKWQMRGGELSSPRRLALPFASAIGASAGAATACAIVAYAGGRPLNTDFVLATPGDAILSLAALALAGPRVTSGLRSLLLAFAVTSSLLTVLLALLLTPRVDAEPLAGAAAALCTLALLSRWRRAPLPLFAGATFALWALTLRSGLDPAAAGVAAALMLPSAPRRLGERGLLDRARHALRPWIVFVVLPLFVASFAAIPLTSVELASRIDPGRVIGLTAGVCVGKAFGAFGACATVVRLGWARRPSGLTWRDLAIASWLCGGGFALNLYLGARVVTAEGRTTAIAAIAAALLAALAGQWALRTAKLDTRRA